MCRFLAYQGKPLFISDLVCTPSHSLVKQSRDAHEAKTATHGDGFGIGWYGARSEPGLYREILPAWSDDNLVSLCSQVKSGLFFAHIRSSTGTSTIRSNCHPFSFDKNLFMHNGQIGGYVKIKRHVESMIPDNLYNARFGTTDSEAIFLMALANGLILDPIGAMTRTLTALRQLMNQADIKEPLRFTAAFTDGRRLWAYRWACDGRAPSLYYRILQDGIVIASEPNEINRSSWCKVPQSTVLIANCGLVESINCLYTYEEKLVA